MKQTIAQFIAQQRDAVKDIPIRQQEGADIILSRLERADIVIAEVDSDTGAPELVPVRRVADLCGVRPATVYNWIKWGWLTRHALPNNRNVRVDLEEVRHVMEVKKGADMPEPVEADHAA